MWKVRLGFLILMECIFIFMEAIAVNLGCEVVRAGLMAAMFAGGSALSQIRTV